jgi:hypothetical protein
MNDRQTLAIEHTSRMPSDTLHRRFARYDRHAKISTILTFNSGFE